MAANPKDALNSARDIATESVRKSADIVENSVEILKGNISDGVGGIIQNSTDIATNAVEKAKEIFTGADDDGSDAR